MILIQVLTSSHPLQNLSTLLIFCHEKISQGKICLLSSPDFISGFFKFTKLPLVPYRPALMLPGASKAVVAVRFCPLAFSLRGLTSCEFLMGVSKRRKCPRMNINNSSGVCCRLFIFQAPISPDICSCHIKLIICL